MKFQNHSLLQTFSVTDVSLKLSFTGIYFLSVLDKLLFIHSCVWLLIFVCLKTTHTQIHSILVLGTEESYRFLLKSKINLLLKSAYTQKIREFFIFHIVL